MDAFKQLNDKFYYVPNWGEVFVRLNCGKMVSVGTMSQDYDPVHNDFPPNIKLFDNLPNVLIQNKVPTEHWIWTLTRN